MIVIAVVGGDRRELEIARLAASAGFDTRVFAAPAGDLKEEFVRAGSVADALGGARALILPIVGLTHGRVFAPASDVPILADRALFQWLTPGGAVVMGSAEGSVGGLIAGFGLKLHVYDDSEDVRASRGPVIAEAALSVIIQNTEIAVENARVAVIGFGGIGSALTRLLNLMGAKTTVFVRSPASLAQARQVASARLLSEFSRHAGDFDVVVSAASGPALGQAEIDLVDARTVIIDLASPPGSIDLEAAKRRSLKAIWARGLGGTAPITLAKAQWRFIAPILRQIQEA